MAHEIINLDTWFHSTAAGNYVRTWQQKQFNDAITDIFGFHALQIGTLSIQALKESRIQHQWKAASEPIHAEMSKSLKITASTTHSQPFDLITAPEALPFQENQLDLIVLPHTLESCHQPHAALREAARVLRPEGKLILTGFNSTRLLGVRPSSNAAQWGAPIGYWRLLDWLKLLELEIDDVRSGCYLPRLSSAKWIERLSWIDTIAQKHVKFLGGIYFIVATKHIKGVRLLGPNWRSIKPKGAKIALPTAPSQTQAPMRQPLNKSHTDQS